MSLKPGVSLSGNKLTIQGSRTFVDLGKPPLYESFLPPYFEL
jgi:hypothetical protein